MDHIHILSIPRFQKIWYTDEITYAFQHNNWHTNSGHFNAIMKRFTECWKKNGGDIWDFHEQIGGIIHQYKDKHLKQLMKYWKDDLENHIETMKKYAKEGDIEETETWRKHSLDTWRELNMIREELKLPLTPIPEILNYSTQEIINKASSEKSAFTGNNNKSPEEKKEFTCEICGKKTDKLYQLRTGQYSWLLPDKKVCWDCYIEEHRKLYEKYGKCPECGANVHLQEWPDFVCENGHIINVNFIEIDTKKILDDAYGKVSVEEYKKLHDKIFTVRNAIEEKYNKPVHNVQITTVNKSVTGVAYTPIWSFPISSLKNKIREAEKITGGVFAGLSVSFNDFTEAWMDEDLVEIEKPELVKKVEKYLKKVTQGYTKKEDNEDSSTTQHTPLTEWTVKGDSNV